MPNKHRKTFFHADVSAFFIIVIAQAKQIFPDHTPMARKLNSLEDMHCSVYFSCHFRAWSCYLTNEKGDIARGLSSSVYYIDKNN